MAMIFRDQLPTIIGESESADWFKPIVGSHSSSWKRGSGMSMEYHFVIFLLSQSLDADFSDAGKSTTIWDMRTDDGKLIAIELQIRL